MWIKNFILFLFSLVPLFTSHIHNCPPILYFQSTSFHIASFFVISQFSSIPFLFCAQFSFSPYSLHPHSPLCLSLLTPSYMPSHLFFFIFSGGFCFSLFCFSSFLIGLSSLCFFLFHFSSRFQFWFVFVPTSFISLLWPLTFFVFSPFYHVRYFYLITCCCPSSPVSILSPFTPFPFQLFPMLTPPILYLAWSCKI